MKIFMLLQCVVNLFLSIMIIIQSKINLNNTLTIRELRKEIDELYEYDDEDENDLEENKK